MLNIFEIIAGENKLRVSQVEKVAELLDQGSTIPFISRYRKEMTGGLDEVMIETLRQRINYFRELEQRKTTVLDTIEGQGKLSDELRERIESCQSATVLEDIYMPYKPKRRTRATMAKEKGLEPLAIKIMMHKGGDVARFEKMASEFVDCQENGAKDIGEALAGASDIIAELVSENESCRSLVRKEFERYSNLECKVVKGKNEEGEKYADYFEFSGSLIRMPSHRLLAILRGERDGFLKFSLEVDSSRVLSALCRAFGASNYLVDDAVEDGYKRMLRPSIENEVMQQAKVRADAEAIKVFASNLRQLLMESPLGQKRVLAIDPGFRTGCKVVCLSAQGDLLDNTNIYPHEPHLKRSEAIGILQKLVSKYDIQAIAIGNGTAGRETEQLVRGLDFGDKRISIYVVSEDGASVYSASEVAREEFADYDVTVRGAVSIGRRLMDPMAELVKIDPKSIGVGQYQHDVDQKALKESLDREVESCVNNVGVNLNTASSYLLSYISGLNSIVARNIVNYRTENGPFKTRKQLSKVPRLGAKTFEQAAGFMRIDNGSNPLDNTAVHPESYELVEKMASDLGVSVNEFIASESLRSSVVAQKYVNDRQGLLTIESVIAQLGKEGRDNRGVIQAFEFADGVSKLEDLAVGMVLRGVVTNITNFGAFVNVGIKQDGLVHISQMSNGYVSDPSQVVSLRQVVDVRVMDVDVARKRLALSMKDV